MTEIFGQIYYIDFDVIDLFLGLNSQKKENGEIEETVNIVYDDKDKVLNKTVTKVTTHKNLTEINGVRYDVVRGLLDDISNFGEGEKLNEMPTNFKLAFNTLTAYGILKPIED